MNREYQKLRRNFAGITEMERLPGGVFVIDPKREELLVKEANRLKIPVLALTDTNCDPEVIDYVIPGNDDAIRSISLISRLVADAIIAGRGRKRRSRNEPCRRLSKTPWRTPKSSAWKPLTAPPRHRWRSQKLPEPELSGYSGRLRVRGGGDTGRSCDRA